MQDLKVLVDNSNVPGKSVLEKAEKGQRGDKGEAGPRGPAGIDVSGRGLFGAIWGRCVE